MKRLEMIAADINAAEAKAKASGRNLASDYLVQHGIGNQEEREAYQSLAGKTRTGVWQNTFVPLMAAPAQPGSIANQFNERVGREPVLLQRQAELSREAMVAQRGVNNPEAALAQVQEAAFNRLKSAGQVVGNFAEWKGRGMLGQMSDNVFLGGYHDRVNFEVQGMLGKEAARIGVNFRSPLSVDARSGLRRELYAGDQAMFDLQKRVQQAGGNPLGGVGDDSAGSDSADQRGPRTSGHRAARPRPSASGPAAFLVSLIPKFFRPSP